MIATQDEEIFGVFDLVGEEKADSLEGLFSSVYIVTEEEVVCFWWKTAIFKKSKEVVVLTMYVPLRNDAHQIFRQESKQSKDGPHILMGASSSSKMGWLMKISLAFVHRYLISYSWSCTGFPGRLPRTGNKGKRSEKRRLSSSHEGSGEDEQCPGGSHKAALAWLESPCKVRFAHERRHWSHTRITPPFLPCVPYCQRNAQQVCPSANYASPSPSPTRWMGPMQADTTMLEKSVPAHLPTVLLSQSLDRFLSLFLPWCVLLKSLRRQMKRYLGGGQMGGIRGLGRRGCEKTRRN